MVHDTAMSQYIPPTLMHYVLGTWTDAAGAVAGTIARAMADPGVPGVSAVVNVPVLVPSNSVALKGAYLKSIEIDYQILTAACTSVTPVVNKVTRGVDGTVVAVAAQTFTQTPTLAVSDDVDEHKLILTITTPFWLLNTEYVLVELTFVAPNTTTIKMLGAVANFTERM